MVSRARVVAPAWLHRARARLNPRLSIERTPASARRRRRGVAGGVIFLVDLDDTESPSREINAQTAHLVETLAEGDAIGRVLKVLDEEIALDLVRLILDDVLQVDVDGGFVGGRDACPLLVEVDPSAFRSDDAVSALSREAVAYAAKLPHVDYASLAARLYFYNRTPVTPEWRQRLPDVSATQEYLGLGRLSPLRQRIERRWKAHQPSNDQDAWLNWSPRAQGSGTDGFHHKLYVSPIAEDMPRALRAVVDVIEGHGTPQFKTGGGLYSLLRPDKLVIYFSTIEALLACAGDLVPALEGVRPHGIPFTAMVGGDRLLSRGVDPPQHARRGEFGEESWRVWIAHRLASALVTAREGKSPEPPAWKFAYTRLELDGVDTRSWTAGERVYAELAQS